MRRAIRFGRRPYVAVPLVGLFAWALYLFKPWALWVDEVVNEAAPAGFVATVELLPSSSPAPIATPSPRAAPPTALPRATEKPRVIVPPAGPTVLARGTFITHEHRTTGTVVVLKLANGDRVLRLENLDTSNGPDLHVWITDAPVIEGTKGWRVFDDGKYVKLGNLKGNKGSQNYALPARVDLKELTSVTVWCDRFNVSFGAAALRAA